MIIIGKVAVEINVMLESPETDVRIVENEIRKKIDVQTVTVKEVAFGLKSLEVLLVLPDGAGGTDKVEHDISEINGVASVTVENMTLI